MEYNELLDWYKDEIKIDKLRYPFKVYAKNFENEDIAKQSIDNVCNYIIDNFENICKAICNKLLDIKNESWLDDDEDPLDKDFFIKILNKIDSISINSDLSSIIYFDDNNLFWGTLIEVRLNKNLEIVDIDLSK